MSELCDLHWLRNIRNRRRARKRSKRRRREVSVWLQSVTNQTFCGVKLLFVDTQKSGNIKEWITKSIHKRVEHIVPAMRNIIQALDIKEFENPELHHDVMTLNERGSLSPLLMLECVARLWNDPHVQYFYWNVMPLELKAGLPKTIAVDFGNVSKFWSNSSSGGTDDSDSRFIHTHKDFSFSIVETTMCDAVNHVLDSADNVINILIFRASMRDYDGVTEDGQNKFEKRLELFSEMCANPSLASLPCIVLLDTDSIAEPRNLSALRLCPPDHQHLADPRKVNTATEKFEGLRQAAGETHVLVYSGESDGVFETMFDTLTEINVKSSLACVGLM